MPASEGKEGLGGGVPAILDQPIYKVCIGNYLDPTCRTPVPCKSWQGMMGEKGKDDERQREKCYHVQKNYASLTLPFLTLNPSPAPMTFPLSPYPATFPRPCRFQSVSIRLVILLHSLHIHSLSPSVPLPLGCPLLYPFPADSILGEQGIPEPL